MIQRIAKNLVRTVIFLLLVQLLVPVAANAANMDRSGSKSYVSVQSSDSQSFSLSLFLKETNSEEETDKSPCSFELIDFTRQQEFFSESHATLCDAPYCIVPPGTSLHKRIRVFLI